MSDTLGGGPAQEEGEGGRPEQRAGSTADRPEARSREGSGGRAEQNWRVCPLSVPLNRLKDTHTHTRNGV